MNRTILRTCCACLLLCIALAAMIGAIAAVSDSQQRITAWTSVRFRTDGQQSLRLYDAEGALLELIQTDEQGFGSSQLLQQGQYHAACADGYVGFCIEESGTLTVRGAAVQGEDGLLSFRGEAPTSVRIEREAAQEWYEYILTGEDYRKSEVVRCKTGEELQCCFSGLPYGEYRLEENGRLLCALTLSADKPKVVLRVP